MITPLFLLSALVIIVTPGPDLVLITHLTLHLGRRDALAAAAGMITAGAGQAAAGIAGMAVLLQTHPTLLTVLRLVGAAVLLWFAVKAFRSALRGGPPATVPSRSTRRSFLTGLASTGTNPKVGLFLMAFLPQFVPAGADPATAMAALASVHLAIGLAWLVLWIHLTPLAGRFLLSPRAFRSANVVIATLLAFLAARLALEI